jgi:hypothetical protein
MDLSESRVYLVTWDVDRFQALLYDLPEEDVSLERHLLFDGRSAVESWTPLPVYSDQPNLERPDIWYHADTHLPVMSGEVLDQLEPVISPLWEPLLLTVSGTEEELFMINVLNVRDALEPGAHSADDLWAFPHFVEHRLPDTGLFLVPQLSSKVFYVERADEDDTLLGRIQHRSLRGMVFLPIWSSSSGAAEANLFEVA